MATRSPHGSRVWELAKYLANRFLSAATRKEIKKTFKAFQAVPRRILGVQGLIEAQQAEIGRLKARLTVLDGKFNLALYGMPSIGEYKATALSNSLVGQLEPLEFRDVCKVEESGEAQAARNSEIEKLFSHSLWQGLRPVQVLWIGMESLLLPSAFLKRWGLPEKFYVVETSALALNHAQTSLNVSRAEWMRTTPLNALLALDGYELDAIFCVGKFQRLAPLEQLHFLDRAVRGLRSGGILYLEVPDLERPEVLLDSYWMEVENLRPYSITGIRKTLSASGGWVEVHRLENSGRLGILFRKE